MIQTIRDRRQAEMFPRYIDKIDVRRVKLGLPIETLCRRAGIGTRSYHYWLAGKIPSKGLRMRVEEALGELERRAKQEFGQAS